MRCRNLTVSNTRTVLLTPEIYVNQNVYEQLVDLLLETLRGARKCSRAVPQCSLCHCLGAARPPCSIQGLGEALAPLAAKSRAVFGSVWLLEHCE